MDLQPFLDWYSSRRTRMTGRPPAQGTLRTKRQRLSKVAELVGATSCENLATLIQSRQRLDALYDQLHARATPGSVRVAHDALVDFSRYCEAMGWPVPPLTANDRPGPNPQKAITVYTEAELDALIGHARAVHGPRWELFLSTLAYTGRRVGEVLGMEFAWFNLSADPPNIHLPYTKNGRQAYVPLNPKLVESWSDADLDALRQERGSGQGYGRDPQVFPFPWTYTCAHKMFVRYCKRVGVESRAFHCFRHTKATSMLARGVPIQAVSAILGHANVATTDRVYNHTSALTYAEYV